MRVDVAALILLLAVPAAAGTVIGRVDITEKNGKPGDPSDAVVYVEGLKAKAKPELPGLALTPMMFAAFAGNGDLIRLLVRHGADVNYAMKDSGQSALTSAISAGKPDMVKLLIELKANVNQKMPDGDTPLKMAKNGDQDDVVAMLKAAGAKE